MATDAASDVFFRLASISIQALICSESVSVVDGLAGTSAGVRSLVGVVHDGQVVVGE